MKHLSLLFFLLLISTIGESQIKDREKDLRKVEIDTIEGWAFKGLLSLNGSQVSLTNWNAGGQNSISINSLVSLGAKYTKNKLQWENSINLGYGLQRQGRKNNARWIKTDDKIDLFSKFGKKASKYWHYSALINFNTQATAGYNYPNDSVAISRFMAPGYLLAAAGMDFKPTSFFSAFIAPFTMKSTFVLDEVLSNQGSFGVRPADTSGSVITPGQKVRYEAGGYIRLGYNHELMENIKITSSLSLFSNYLNNPQNIDVQWETLIQFKVNKYISATLSTHLIYDDDIDIAVYNDDGVQIGKGPRLQFKEVLGVGFAYRFPAPAEKKEKEKKD
ncbi:MAG: DUF3078 domain-containing protein [Crocinitomicaceae bacterium]